MTIRHLRTLVAVADARTFSAAANIVHVTHAAVSQQMKALETELEVTLFNRATRPPELTPIGHDVVAKAREIIAEYDSLGASLSADGGLSGTITLGALRTTLTGLTPQAMAVLKSRFPEIGLHIRPGLTGRLLAEVARGALDGAIITRPHLLPPGLRFRTLTDETLHLIASPQEVQTDPLRLLQERPFIRFNRNAVLGTLIDDWIVSKRIPVTETMELDSPEAIVSMVHANLGVSIVPAAAVKPYDTVPVKRIGLGRDAPVRTLGLVQQTNGTKAKALDEVCDALRTVINAQGDKAT